jgi:hypothetical protein
MVSLILAAALSDTPPAEMRDRANQILDHGAYQRALPAAPSPPREQVSGDSTRFEAPMPGAGPAVEAAGGLIGPTLFFVLFAAGLAWLALLIVRRWHHAPADSASVASTAAAQTRQPRSPVISVDSADALARAGRFGEALRALLIAALQEVSGRARLAPSLTTREVLRAAPLGGERRTALGALAEQEEGVEFGGRPAGREDYEKALDHYRRFMATWRKS